MRAIKETQPDPLYVIFEQHLLNFQDSESDRKTFIGNVILDYLTYLRKMNIIVPHALESAVIDELGAQVQSMLVKKIYGCLTIGDFRKKTASTAKRKARSRYAKLAKR